MNSQLFINNQIADLFQDVAISLNYAIADIREPDKRDSAFSKTITLPGSVNNNKIFTSYFDLKYSTNSTGTTNFSPDFNPNLKATARLVVDGSTILSGILQLNKAFYDYGGEVQYEVTLSGRTMGLFQELGEVLLSEVDFSDLDHMLSYANVTAAWTPTIGEGYCYPYINNSSTTDFSQKVDDFKPAIFLKEYVDRIFEYAGYIYESDFFNGDYFKKLIIPYSGLFLKKSAEAIASYSIKAGLSATKVLANKGLLTTETVVPLDVDSGVTFYDEGNNFDTGTYRYTVSFSGNFYNISASITLRLKFDQTFTTGLSATIIHASPNIYLLPNGQADIPTNWKLIAGGYNGLFKFEMSTNTTYTAGTYLNLGATMTTSIASIAGGFSTGDKIEMRVNTLVPSNEARYHFEVISQNTYLQVAVHNEKISEGETVLMNKTLPDKLKAKELLTAVIKTFNLFIEPDQSNIKKLKIEPRDDFYTSDVVDWSGKLDRSEDVTSMPMPFLDASQYVYSYKEDKDYWNSQYLAKYGYNYGSRFYNINNDFVGKQKKQEVIFAPTPNVGNPINSIVCPQIINIDKDGKITDKPAVVRLLFWGGLKDLVGSATWDMTTYTTVIKKSNYPYAGVWDDPYWATYDLGFAVTDELFYDNTHRDIHFTRNNLFNQFHKRYIDEITDKDSRLVSGKFKLTVVDIANLDFRKLYHLDGVNYRLNKIEDYNPLGNAPVKVELIRIKRNADTEVSSGTTYGGWIESPPLNEQPPTLFNHTIKQNGNVYYNNMVEVVGDNNSISSDSYKIKVLGTNNTILGDSYNVNLVNTSGVVVKDGASNVSVINSSGMTISKGNVNYMGNIEYPHTATTGTTIFDQIIENETINNYLTGSTFPAYKHIEATSGSVHASDNDTAYIYEGEGIKTYVSGTTFYVENDYLNDPVYFEDFVSGNNTSGQIGAHNWNITNGAAGHGFSPGRPGILTRTSSTTAGVPSTLYPAAATGSDRFSYTNFDYIMFSFALVDTENHNLRIGVFDDCSLTTPNGIWLNVNNASGYFDFQCGNGVSVDTYAGDVLRDTGWHTVVVQRINNGSNVFAKFIIDGYVYEMNSVLFPNNPASGGLTGANIGIMNSTDTVGVSKQFYLDYVKWKMTNVIRGF